MKCTFMINLLKLKLRRKMSKLKPTIQLRNKQLLR